MIWFPIAILIAALGLLMVGAGAFRDGHERFGALIAAVGVAAVITEVWLIARLLTS